MFEWATARLILGLCQFVLVWSLRRRRVGYLLWFGVVTFWSAAINIAPAYPKSQFYKYCVQVPAFLISLILTVAATVDVFRFLPRRTFPQERSLLLAFSVVVGLVGVTSGWIWRPENWYQAVMIGRQYVLLALLAAYTAAWAYLQHIRPVQMEGRSARHGRLWGCWLITTALLSSTTKGGLLWQVLTWTGGSWDWRAVSTYLLVAQIVITWRIYLNLQKWGASTAAEPTHHGRAVKFA